jgi:hypothetical protein
VKDQVRALQQRAKGDQPARRRTITRTSTIQKTTAAFFVASNISTRSRFGGKTRRIGIRGPIAQSPAAIWIEPARRQSMGM